MPNAVVEVRNINPVAKSVMEVLMAILLNWAHQRSLLRLRKAAVGQSLARNIRKSFKLWSLALQSLGAAWA